MQSAIFLLYFLSGFSALVYEISWVRELSLSLGKTAQATSIVLAVFLGGLAIGSFLAPRVFSRLQIKPLALYGYLEIGVGITALLVSQSFKLAPFIYVALYHSLSPEALTAIRLLISGGVLLVPAMLMGATLPVMVRYLDQFKLSALMFSLLYGINTLGAAAGGMAACFAGFAYLGMQGTMLFAAGINFIVGLLSIILSGRAAGTSEPAVSNLQPDKNENETAQSADTSMFLLCTIAFMCGFTALSYEVLWTRILRCFLTSLTYSFTIMISMFLLGLAIGSLVYEKYILSRRTSQPPAFLEFGLVQYLAAALCAASVPILLISIRIQTPLERLGLFPYHQSSSEPQYQLLYIFLVSLLSILAPSIVLGILFPLIGTLAAGKEKRAPQAVSLIYAFNTLGCVAGSLITGLYLIPSIGSYTSLQRIVLVSTLTGAIAILCSNRMKLVQRLALVLIPMAVANYYAFFVYTGLVSPADRPFVAVGEDATGALIITASPHGDGMQMMFNGSLLASTIPSSLRYMRLLGDLPVLMHPRPEKVLVGCFGTGTTCGAVSVNNDVKQLDVVELSKMILNASALFGSTNHGVLRNPKVHAHVNDVRNYLLTCPEKYQVVTFEPPPPCEAGIVNLYTAEFYALVARHLTEDGLMCQWVPVDQDSNRLWKMMIASARAIYPNVAIWMPNSGEAVLMASKQPLRFDFADMQKRIDQTPQLKQDLDDVGLGSAMQLLSTFVMSDRVLDNYIQGAQPVTDDRPSLEFFLPWAGPLTKELDLESAGLSQLRGFAAKHQHDPGFNPAEFDRSWQSIHFLRQAGVAGSAARADSLIDSALSLMPKTRWWQFVNTRRGQFYRANTEYPAN